MIYHVLQYCYMKNEITHIVADDNYNFFSNLISYFHPKKFNILRIIL
jgi:hypothetical protein